MRISVVILCRNEAGRIGDCLAAVEALDYPSEKFEILIVDNDSSDATRDVVREYMERLPNLRMVVNPVLGIAPGRNMGLREAAHDFIAFTDADCRVPPHWLRALAEGFRRNREVHPGLAAVGGTNCAPACTLPFYDAVNIVLKTELGNRGSTQGKEFGRDTVVDHVPTLNILYCRKTVLEMGGFDEAFRFVCEDPDLNYRLTKSDRVIVHLDGCSVVHAFTPGYRAWARKVFGYGRGRSQLLRKHADKSGLVYVVAPMICAAWLLAALAPLTWGYAAVPLAAYLLAMAVYSAIHSRGRGALRLWPRVMALYLLTHVSFGLGQIVGFFSSRDRTP